MVTKMVELLLDWPVRLETVKVAVKLPVVLLVCFGSRVAAAKPSPNAQLHALGPPVERSVNCTVRGAAPELGLATKAAVTPGVTEMVEFVLPNWPAELETTNMAVKSPAVS